MQCKNIIKLNKRNKNDCEGLVTEEEVKLVIKNMENNKSPGTDGFPIEFYKFFWIDIGTFLILTFECGLQDLIWSYGTEDEERFAFCDWQYSKGFLKDRYIGENV